MDNRLNEGVINFSIETSAAIAPKMECYSFYTVNDYWYGSRGQLVYSMKERVSFIENKGTNDTTNHITVPFKAQKAFNFGGFTMANRKLDEHGNFGFEGQEVSHPVIHNFDNGRKLTYILGGISGLESKEREIIIRATRRVVKEWNDAFKLIYKGTVNERTTSYVDLLVEGEDAPKGNLGDLDKNYIWYYSKTFDTGIAGLAQAAPNPKSGVVEATNVLMFGGNIKSSLASMQRVAKAVRAYEAGKEKIKQLLEEDFKQKNPDWGKKPADDGADSEGNGNGEENGSEDGTPSDNQGGDQPEDVLVDEAELNEPGPIVNGSSVESLMKKLNESGASEAQKIALKKALAHAKRGFKQTKKLAKNIKIKTVNPKTVKLEQKSVKNIKKALMDQIVKKGNFKAKFRLSQIDDRDAKAEQLFIKNFIEKAIEQKITTNPRALSSLAGQEYLKAYSHKMTADQVHRLAAQVQKDASIAQLQKNFSSRPGCITDINEGQYDSSDIAEGDFWDLYERQYTQILAHEIGHTVGLTHNFRASTDFANFKFTEDGEKVTDYSSVMDYMQLDVDVNYHGLGEYDKYAIRALYTGYVELADGAKAKLAAQIEELKNKGQKIEMPKIISQENEEGMVKDYIHMEEYRALLGVSWLEFTKYHAATIELRSMKYCTDEDVSWEPLCQRFDKGTNAVEVVENTIEDYKKLYVWKNSSQGRLEFGHEYVGNYIGRTFNTFFNMRQFMDESFYKIIVEQDQSAFADHAIASIKSWMLMNEVILTADTSAEFFDTRHGYNFPNPERFGILPYKWQEEIKDPLTGQSSVVTHDALHLVELKTTQDRWSPENRLDTMGIEFDKLISIITLTQRGLGYPKYEQHSLNLSFLDFEKYILGQDAQNSLIIGASLAGILSNAPMAFTGTEKAGIVPLPGAPVTITESMRYYAALSGVVFNESNSLVDKDNFATLFRVGSSIGGAPKDRVSVGKLGINADSDVGIKFWSYDNAVVSDMLIGLAAPAQLIINNAEELKPSVQKILKATHEAELAQEKEDLAVAEARKAAEAKARQEGKTEEEIIEIVEAIKGKEVRTIDLEIPVEGAPNGKITLKVTTAEKNFLEASARDLKEFNKKNKFLLMPEEIVQKQPKIFLLISAMLREHILEMRKVLYELAPMGTNPILDMFAPMIAGPFADALQELPLYAIAQLAMKDLAVELEKTLSEQEVAEGASFIAVTDLMLSPVENLMINIAPVMANIELMNRFFYMMYPEYMRQ